MEWGAANIDAESAGQCDDIGPNDEGEIRVVIVSENAIT